MAHAACAVPVAHEACIAVDEGLSRMPYRLWGTKKGDGGGYQEGMRRPMSGSRELPVR